MVGEQSKEKHSGSRVVMTRCSSPLRVNLLLLKPHIPSAHDDFSLMTPVSSLYIRKSKLVKELKSRKASGRVL